MSDLFGQIISPKAVEEAVVASLDVWLDDYLGKLERVEGYEPNAIERPLGIINSSEFAKWPEDQIPVVVVINMGLAGKPERHGDGKYDASWLVGVAAVVSDQDQASTRDLAFTYLTAIRVALAQHKMLKSDLHPDGFANFSMWHDETYGEIAFSESRTLGAGRSIFEIGVENVMTEFAGPREPSGDPTVEPDPLPEAVVPTITAEPVTIGGSL
jgi:hypothetical protein